MNNKLLYDISEVLLLNNLINRFPKYIKELKCILSYSWIKIIFSREKNKPKYTWSIKITKIYSLRKIKKENDWKVDMFSTYYTIYNEQYHNEIIDRILK